MPYKMKPVMQQQTFSNLTDEGKRQLEQANQQQRLDINATTDQLYQQMLNGLNMFGTTNTSNQVNQALDTSNNLINNAAVPAGNVDFSAYSPYMQTGSMASQEAARLAGLGPDAYNSQQIYDRYMNNPATQFQMEQGNRQINSNAAARGMLGSGAILKALQSYGQGLASQGLGQAQNNLYNLAQQGATASNQYASNLLNKYTTDQQSALAAKQNQTNLLGQQAGLISTGAGNAQSQSGFLQSMAQAQAQIQAQAAAQRQSSLVGNLGNVNTVYGMGYDNYMPNTVNSTFRGA